MITRRLEKPFRILSACVKIYPELAASSEIIHVPVKSSSRKFSVSNVLQWRMAGRLPTSSSSCTTGVLEYEKESMPTSEVIWRSTEPSDGQCSVFNDPLNGGNRGDYVDDSVLGQFDIDEPSTYSDSLNFSTIIDVLEEPTSGVWEGVPVVTITSNFETDSTGRLSSSKIDVCWDSESASNRHKELDCKSKIEADFEALFFALRQAIYELHLPLVIVRINSSFLCKEVLPRINFWHKSSLPQKIRKVYAEHLAELWRLLKFIDAKIEFFGSETIPEAAVGEAEKAEDSEGAPPENSKFKQKNDDRRDAEATQVVYVSGAFQNLNPLVKEMCRGGCGVYWPDKISDDVSSRVRMKFLTPHRAHIQAITLALKAAVEKNVKSLVVKTNFREFSNLYGRFHQRKAGKSEEPLTNILMYERINALEQKLKAVSYEFIDSEDPCMREAISLANTGMKTKQSTFFKKGRKGDSVTPSEPDYEKQTIKEDLEKALRVNITSSRTEDGLYECRAVWENDSTVSPVVTRNDNSSSVQNMCKTLLQVLEQVKERNETSVVVNLGSKRFWQSVVHWMPKWRLNNWKTATGKPPVGVKLWKEIDAHLSKIQVRWELDEGRKFGKAS